MRDKEPEGATPLSEEDYEGLKLSGLVTRDQLNFAEALSINDARAFYESRRLEINGVLDDLFVRRLHHQMFGAVWDWAGRYRTRNTNIGVDSTLIATSVHALVHDARLWFAQSADRDTDRLACQVHHRLVSIHPFPNGNGRHSRLYTDLLLTAIGKSPFAWGQSHTMDSSLIRERYLEALREADRGDLQPLVHFVRS